MKHIDGVPEFCHINDPPLTQFVYANFFYAWTDTLYGLPVAGIKSALNSMEFKPSGPARFDRKLPKVVQARSDKPQWFHRRGDII